MTPAKNNAPYHEIATTNAQVAKPIKSLKDDATANEIAKTYTQIAETMKSLKGDATANEIAKTYERIAGTIKDLNDDVTALEIAKVTYTQVAESVKALNDNATDKENDQVTYSQIVESVKALDDKATVQQIADMLTYLEAVYIAEQDRPKVENIETNLIGRLRAKIKREISILHNRALKASSYRGGYAIARDAGAVLALYPLSDAPAVINEAEELSFKQNEVMRRLELIRKQRYNHWAAGQAEEALKKLREKGKDGTEAGIAYLCVIEPSLLESSVASLYSYCVNEIMDKYKKDERANVTKKLTNPSTVRRSLEDF